MLFTLKNIEMQKKIQKVEFKGWLRAALVLLYSVSIQIRSFELLAHFWPLNQFRNPSKRYTPFRTCRSQFVAFLQHQIWSTWGKIRGQKANFVHQELRENQKFLTAWLSGQIYATKTYHRVIPTVQTLQDMWKSGCGLLHHQIWLTWVKIRGQKENFNSRCTKFAFWPLILPQANQIWCCKRPQPDFHMSLRVCTVGVTL
jgi:hypothetical protein